MSEKEKKITCGVREPKKTERRGTMKECAKKKQLRYYGIKKVDRKLIESVYAKQKPVKKNDENARMIYRAGVIGLKSRIIRLEKYIESFKKVGNTKKEEEYKKMLEDVKKEYKRKAARFNKMVDDAKKAKEKEEENKKKKEMKEKDKKENKKSSKKRTGKKIKKSDK